MTHATYEHQASPRHAHEQDNDDSELIGRLEEVLVDTRKDLARLTPLEGYDSLADMIDTDLPGATEAVRTVINVLTESDVVDDQTHHDTLFDALQTLRGFARTYHKGFDAVDASFDAVDGSRTGTTDMTARGAHDLASGIANRYADLVNVKGTEVVRGYLEIAANRAYGIPPLCEPISAGYITGSYLEFVAESAEAVLGRLNPSHKLHEIAPSSLESLRTEMVKLLTQLEKLATLPHVLRNQAEAIKQRIKSTDEALAEALLALGGDEAAEAV